MEPEASLATALRAETRALHRSVERSRFMQALLGGGLRRPAYCLLLRSLREIYRALEDGLRSRATHPEVASIVSPALFRQATIEQDLRTLHGDAWLEELAPASTASAYAEQLSDLARARPALLVAHAYVRYLGDLNGGQSLRRIVSETLGLSGGAGTTFYDFGDPESVAEHSRSFRAGLDELSPRVERRAIVEEAKRAFVLHQSLFDELARSPSADDAR